MNYRHLGNSGLRVSAIGLGTNQFGGKVDKDGATAIIHAALEAGINFIDTADIYREGRSEEAIGAAVKAVRKQVLLATKARHPMGEGPNDRGTSRHHLLNAVEGSLRRLGTDYIDLYQMHTWDPETPIEETLRTLEDLVRAGKVRYIGASNFSAWQLTHANAVAELRGWTQFVSIQPHYHMLHREVESELQPACAHFNIGMLPYFPLAGGFLTGKYRRDEAAPKGSRGEESPYVQRYMTPENYTIVEQLGALAAESGHSLNELAHAWLLAQPQVSSVISGATKPEHVQANAKAADWTLSAEELARADEILGKRSQ